MASSSLLCQVFTESGSSAGLLPSTSWTASRHIRSPLCYEPVCGPLPEWNQKMTNNSVQKMASVKDAEGYLLDFYGHFLL